jgi:hypothetical protein
VVACPHGISVVSQKTLSELTEKGSAIGINITVVSSAV